MSKIEAYAMTGLSVLITLVVYNLFLKAFLPTGIRNAVGLG